jgi:hypothetical protein
MWQGRNDEDIPIRADQFRPLVLLLGCMMDREAGDALTIDRDVLRMGRPSSRLWVRVGRITPLISEKSQRSLAECTTTSCSVSTRSAKRMNGDGFQVVDVRPKEAQQGAFCIADSDIEIMLPEPLVVHLPCCVFALDIVPDRSYNVQPTIERP